ncbi:MAG TPA: ATP-binding cassette domain-containing protein [Steroidobacteraceae bacterium]|nr:ATP-binding cassette domain-containing protein [Steroidobacteraceae bacterium]
MRGLLVERLRPFALIAFGASAVLHFALAAAAICALQLLHRLPILGSVVLLGALFLYAADCVRGNAFASAGRAVDRDLVPAAIANSLDALRDIRLLRTFLGSPGMLALLDVPWLLVYLCAIAWIHPLLGLGGLLGAALLIFGLAIAGELQKPERSDSMLLAARRAHDHAEDLVRSAETLVGMGMSHSAIAAWRERHEYSVSCRQHGDRGAARLGALARAGSLALQIAMLGVGALLVVDSRLGIADMIVAVLLLGKALQPVEQLIGSWPSITAARGAWLRLNQRAPRIVVAGTDAPIAAGRVELERVCYALAGRPAFMQSVTLSLAPGESILIVGPSGCGKSTLARLVLGVLRPYSGTVRLDSIDLARWDRAALGQCVGYVPQEVHLFAGTIADNIARLGALDSERVVQAARAAHVHEMIVRMPEGYHTEVAEGGAGLPASQRRRIALARALYVNPRLVVLDEPGVDLDAEGELALIKTLAGLKQRGVTVVIVGQRTGLLEHVDRMAFLRDGTLQSVERRELPPLPSAAAVVPLHRPTPQPL